MIDTVGATKSFNRTARHGLIALALVWTSAPAAMAGTGLGPLDALREARPGETASHPAPPAAMNLPGHFEVAPSGAATYSVMLDVPPATLLSPSLTLEYSSRGGDGIMGLGWSLTIGAVNSLGNAEKADANNTPSFSAPSEQSLGNSSSQTTQDDGTVIPSAPAARGGSESAKTGMSMDAIERCPRTVAQDTVHGGINYNADDRFCLNGARLVLTSGTYGVANSVYHKEIEDFGKVTASGTSGSGPTSFVLQTGSGEKYFFGSTADSRAPLVAVPGSTTGVAGTVRAWMLSRVEDAKGNYFTIQYDNGTPDTVHGQVYPTRIDYTGNNSGPSTYSSIQFFYTSRSDTFPVYTAGALTQVTQLLTHIKTFNGTTLVSDYQLTYNTGASPGMMHQQLNKIARCDASGTTCLAATTFGWQGGTGLPAMSGPISDGFLPRSFIQAGDFNGDGLTDAEVSNLLLGGTLPPPNDYLTPVRYDCPDRNVGGVFLGNLAGTTFTQSNYPFRIGGNDVVCAPRDEIADINGDGFSDTLGYPDDHGGYLNNQNGRLSYVGPPPDFGSMGDFDGDGMMDDQGGFYGLVIGHGVLQGTRTVKVRSGDGTGNYHVVKTLYPDIFYADSIYDVRALDFDGDGCEDHLVQSTSVTTSVIFFECQPAVSSINVPALVGMPWYYPYQQVFGDFNGDGKTDSLVVGGDSKACSQFCAGEFLSTGTGFVQTSFSIPPDWANYVPVVGDWNGDGMSDLMLLASGQQPKYGTNHSHLIFLSTGTGFTQVTTLANTDSRDQGGAFNATYPPPIQASIADWNNDGASDIWLSRVSSNVHYTFAYKPESIISITNGLGVTTTIQYDKLNNPAVYTKGHDATYPTMDLAGPTYVVSQVSENDGAGGSDAWTYTYAGAKKDLSGRGFLGFTKVTTVDQQTHVIKTVNYITGFPYTGLVGSQASVCPLAYCPNGAGQDVTLSSTTYCYDTDPLCQNIPPTGGSAPYLVEVMKKIETASDADGAALPSVTTVYSYDAFANPLTTTETVSDGSTRAISANYSNDSTDWLLGRMTTMSETVTVPGQPAITRSFAYCYDLPSSSCRDAGNPTPSGMIMTRTIEPSDTSCLYQLSTYQYDAFGNRHITSMQGLNTGCGAVRTNEDDYDAATGRFLTTTKNPYSQADNWDYSSASSKNFGVPTSHTDANGVLTSWVYDTFGRLTEEDRADGTETTFNYDRCATQSGTVSCTGVTQAGPDNAQFYASSTRRLGRGQAAPQDGPTMIEYFDSFGRLLARDSQGFDGTWIRTDKVYDGQGRVTKTSRPHFIGDPVYWTTNSYVVAGTSVEDAFGRVQTATAPDTGTTAYVYDGLTTKITNADGQTTTTIRNAQGLIAQVKDALDTTDPGNHTTQYTYDSEGDLLIIADPAGNTTTSTYDIRGRKLTLSDPDMGQAVGQIWVYAYNAFAEQVQQTDAKGQVGYLAYDLMGRVSQRQERDPSNNWSYINRIYNNTNNATNHDVGKLTAECRRATSSTGCSGLTSSDFNLALTYDTLSRTSTSTSTIEGTTYQYATSYNGDGYIDHITRPSGLRVDYAYTGLGFLNQLKDHGSTTVFWTANLRDAEMNLQQWTAGNGVVTTQNFDPLTGRIQQILAGPSNSIANFNFDYDKLGNLTDRSDMIASGGVVTESMCYDDLNRLIRYSLNGTNCRTGSNPKTVAYDAIGNILRKSDVSKNNGYLYGNGAGPHALTSLLSCGACMQVAGVASPAFTYDADGNMTCELPTGQTSCASGAPRYITWTSFNMVDSMSEGSATLQFTYDADHARVKQVYTMGSVNVSTVYLNAMGLRSEKVSVNGLITWRDYIEVDGKIVALRSNIPNGSPPVTVDYFIPDHLGSISVITDGTPGSSTYSQAVERLSYDAWGKRRSAADWSDDPTCSVQSLTTRGFTGHEEMDSVCLVNMNARIYEPSLGRFMSVDPVTSDVYDLQELNRYSYVDDDPTTKTDPTGECASCAVGAIFGGISGAVGGYTSSGTLRGAVVGGITGALVGAVAQNPMLASGLGSATGQLAGKWTDNLASGKPWSSDLKVDLLAVGGSMIGSRIASPGVAWAERTLPVARAPIIGKVVGEESIDRSLGKTLGSTLDGFLNGLGEKAGNFMSELSKLPTNAQLTDDKGHWAPKMVPSKPPAPRPAPKPPVPPPPTRKDQPQS